MSTRRRPFLTCGVSGLAIVHQACTKAHDLDGPIGSMAKRVTKIAKFIEPLLYALQHQSLAILSFLDDRILAVESIVETVFPPSKHVFNKIDQCVEIVEILLGKFGDAINEACTVIHQFPLLDWALPRVISWLNFWVSVLTETQKEKEIMVGKSCNVESSTVEDEANQEPLTTRVAISDREAFPPTAETPQAEEAVDFTVMKSTYKEALEKGTIENTEKDDQKENHLEQFDMGEKETNKEGGENNKSDSSHENKDDILELFETAWLMQPIKRRAEKSS